MVTLRARSVAHASATVASAASISVRRASGEALASASSRPAAASASRSSVRMACESCSCSSRRSARPVVSMFDRSMPCVLNCETASAMASSRSISNSSMFSVTV